MTRYEKLKKYVEKNVMNFKENGSFYSYGELSIEKVYYPFGVVYYIKIAGKKIKEFECIARELHYILETTREIENIKIEDKVILEFFEKI